MDYLLFIIVFTFIAIWTLRHACVQSEKRWKRNTDFIIRVLLALKSTSNNSPDNKGK